MLNSCRPARAATATVVAILFAFLTSPWRVACAIEPLPAEIPEVAVNRNESIRKLVEAIERIEKPTERLKVHQQAFFRIHSLGRDRLQPLLALIERDATRWTDKNSIAYLAEGLSVVHPELLVTLSQEVSDDRILDRNWSLYSGRMAPTDQAKSRVAIAKIKDPERRATALIVFAQNSTLTLEEVKKVLEEIDGIGWPKYYSPRHYVIGSAFSRLADDQLPGALTYIVSSLPPDEAVKTLSHLSVYLRHFSKRPALADRALEAAVLLVPQCENRAAAAGDLLGHGLARLDRERAAQIKLEYSAPSIRLKPKIKRIPIGLADGGLEFSLGHAAQLAKRTGIPEEAFVLGEVGHAAAHNDVDEVLAWLRKQPASSARGLAAGCIAEGLANRLGNQYVDPVIHQSWIDLLGKEILAISDPRQRREGVEQVLMATHAPKSKARITVPLEMRREYGRLWDDPAAAPDRPRETWQIVSYSRLLPTDMQLRQIEKLFSRGHTTAAANILDHSSLDGDLRREWYDKLLDRARAIQDKSKRATVLVAIARFLRDEDPAKSISALWEGLQLAKPFVWSDIPSICDIPEPPSNPDEALGTTFVDFRGGGDLAVKALWEFAHKVDAADEREPLLEALAKVLVEQDQTARAAGITTLLSDPRRQARVWIEIARRLHGVKDENP